MKIVQVIPEAQVEILKDALDVYETAIKTLKSDDDMSINYKVFDIAVLKGLLKSKVSIEMSEAKYNSFTHDNGVDFPKYID